MSNKARGTILGVLGRLQKDITFEECGCNKTFYEGVKRGIKLSKKAIEEIPKEELEGAKKMKIGYICRHNLEMNPHLTERFSFKTASFTRKISSKGDRVYSKLLAFPVDYEEIVDNANMMKGDSGLILVTEPFLLDDELMEKAIKWVEWANNADPKEYDPFA